MRREEQQMAEYAAKQRAKLAKHRQSAMRGPRIPLDPLPPAAASEAVLRRV